ncbi:class I adenylate-forming enzyme family protein [Halosegnis longus]|uniref:class I adenylate-forming enzyme family protein n=1 Tax=Halosegnis longus TaxID=2216012 RepID=UPI00096AB996|nr:MULTISPECIES: AMP-binding protein [Halobacteriales]
MHLDLDTFGDTVHGGNVARMYDKTAAVRGDAPALESHGEEVTHEELQAVSSAFAGGLRELGVEETEPVMLYLPNCPQYVIASLGCFRAGSPVSPVNPQYRSRELVHQLTDTDAAAVITHVALREHLGEAIDDIDGDPAVITVGDREAMPEGDTHFDDVRGEPTTVDLDGDAIASMPYTSGTTGQPKGVRLTHDNIRAQLLTNIAVRSDDLTPDEENSLVWLPLYHITGFVHTALQPLARGGTLYIRSAANWDAKEAMATIEREKISSFIGVTAMYADMVDDDSFGDYDLSSLVTASEGGAKLTGAVQDAFEETAGVAIKEGYGLTETTGSTHTQVGSLYGPRHGTVGQPARHTDCRIVDSNGDEVPLGETGEILVRGPQVMDGYHNRPKANEQAFTDAGFFRTGDIGRRDEEGYYEIVDRKKHVIVTAGYNVYPSEVENLLAEHESVREAAVVGIPHERRNETVKAFVVPANGDPGNPGVTADEIQQFSLDNIAPYKHPREVEFVAELPRTASGKIQKYKLTDE